VLTNRSRQGSLVGGFQGQWTKTCLRVCTCVGMHICRLSNCVACAICTAYTVFLYTFCMLARALQAASDPDCQSTCLSMSVCLYVCVSTTL